MGKISAGFKYTIKTIKSMDFRTPKGTRDIMQKDAENVEKLLDVVRSIFRRFGFSPLFTPAFEDFNLLSVKGGLGEGVKDDIYYFKDKSNRELGLRFDLTMPMVRVVATNPQIKKPFRRYAIGRVWRYDQPQAMRYREFWQADVDIVGAESAVADAECLAVACECLEQLGFKNFYVRVNNRKMLQSVFESAFEIDNADKIKDVFRSIDKLDKIGEEGVEKELNEKGVKPKQIKKMMKFLETKGSNDVVLKKLSKIYGDVDGLVELRELIKYSKQMKIAKRVKIDVSMVRGLDYYTGSVFEVELGEGVSCGGGGRYDALIQNVGGPEIPATGISLGISRIFQIMKDKEMFGKLSNGMPSVFVANVDEDVFDEALKIAAKLRKKEIPTQTDSAGRNLGKQLEYADAVEVDYVVIVGKDELKEGKLTLKDMVAKSEDKLTLSDVIKKLKSKNKGKYF